MLAEPIHRRQLLQAAFLAAAFPYIPGISTFVTEASAADLDPKTVARLKKYGLDGTKLKLIDLKVDAGKRLVTSPDLVPSRAISIDAATIDRQKEILGVPNVLASKLKISPSKANVAEYTPARLTKEKLSPEERQAWNSIRMEYLYGDSSRVAGFQKLIDVRMSNDARRISMMHWQDITIESGAVLEVHSTDVLFGCHLKIKRGGRLIAHNLASLDFETIERA